VIENIEPVNAPSCYCISLLSGSLEVTARLKSVDDLDLLLSVLESNRAFFVKNDRLAAEVIDLDLRFRSGSVSPGLSLRRLRSAQNSTC
jgi:hypothetical protein